jgi:MFS family permease
MSSVTQRPAENDHRWLILVIVAIAQLMVVLDATVVNIALPSAQRALGFPNGDRQWVVTAYALAFGSLPSSRPPPWAPWSARSVTRASEAGRSASSGPSRAAAARWA